jgi:hypothetical protein
LGFELPVQYTFATPKPFGEDLVILGAQKNHKVLMLDVHITKG